MKNIQKALILTILVSATIHLGSLITYGIIHNNFSYLNAFSILSLDIWNEELTHNPSSFLLSWIFVGLIFVLCFFVRKMKK